MKFATNIIIFTAMALFTNAVDLGNRLPNPTSGDLPNMINPFYSAEIVEEDAERTTGRAPTNFDPKSRIVDDIDMPNLINPFYCPDGKVGKKCR